MPIVKIRTNRQVTIPKKIFDELGLKEGEYVEVAIHGKTIVLTPKTLIDKDLEEALEDIEQGRVIGPFTTAAEAIRALKQAKLLTSSSPASS
jgi:AbrB family looped-hinge helix DNA binding protein